MKSILLTGAWGVATIGLYLSLLMLEVYWNLADWHPHLDLAAAALLLAILMALAGIWRLSRTCSNRLIASLSLLLCVGLLGLGFYVLPPEPLTSGLFARQSSSPLWYRGGRLLIMVLPGVFWATQDSGASAALRTSD